ncbi:P-loop containing nucleoside triphosphate hydrolase protein [Xylariaceae sp. FL1651]|nr:P-loop containing nucleoside triphosphate hydrolase protein [Xylariaceae sp. FL1651]
MYSRYIPPKGAINIPDAQQTTSPQPPLIPAKLPPTTYARYVPPAKSNSLTFNQTSPAQHVRFDDGGSDHEGPPAKRVKLVQEGAAAQFVNEERLKKKKRKSTLAIGLGGSVDGDGNGEVAMRDGEQDSKAIGTKDVGMQQLPDERRPSPKEHPQIAEGTAMEQMIKRKDKKKRKMLKDNEESLAQTEDDTPLRHKAILEKKEKSIRKAPEPDNLNNGPETEDVVMGDASADIVEKQKSPEIELHGLEPIPQPKPVALDTSTPTYETLPPWLASPIRVSHDASAPFTKFGLSPDLGITPEIAERLALKGYKHAFAIQTGVIPLLLPHHSKAMQGDVLVSAATGSGKTLAYTLPLIRDLSQGSRHVTRLRAVIVLPTRELVKQVQQVCEEGAGAFALDGAKRRPRIAMAMGSQSFEHEQNLLVEREERYDPEAYKQRIKRLARLSGSDSTDENDSEGEDSGYDTEDEERKAIRKREDSIQTLPDHVIVYKSKVDILICTPGRLVEHIKFTPGFSLDFVRWLVVDEADKLLGQNFQQWLDVVIPRVQSNNHLGARNHKQSNLSGVRKVILSATMTRDLDQLEGLKLRRPKLVVLEGSELQDEDRDGGTQIEHALPGLLEEAALKVSDPNLKPLFLVDLLRSNHILAETSHVRGEESDDEETSSSGSDSDSDSDSESGPSRKPTSSFADTSKAWDKMPTVLIFTKSNETTLRLSRLLTLLAPTFESHIGTLTSTTPYTTRRDTMRSFKAGKLSILVASDLVARGIDLPSLDHVVNYDMPSSIASYVHRVGRTARAGKTGKAWTLFTNQEARWFWNEVASQKVIQRSKKVERIRVTEEKEDAFDDKVATYEAALEKLGQEAGQVRQKGRGK